jgi:uridylate kinase
VTTVVSLGGSIVAPEGPDAVFLAAFRVLVDRHLAVDPKRRLILVVGGGGPARLWQKAFREVAAALKAVAAPEAQDWVGIMATRLNAQLVKAILGELAPQDVVIDPSAVELFMGRIMVAAGWKPGFSTDYDAVVLAGKFGADTVVNLSNVAKVHTDDPRSNPDAKPIDRITWKDFRALVGEEWSPGKNVPFDPIASKQAAEFGLRVICAAGRDLPNLEAILEGRDFTGTVIGPE